MERGTARGDPHFGQATTEVLGWVDAIELDQLSREVGESNKAARSVGIVPGQLSALLNT